MSDDIKAARERLRRYFANEPVLDIYPQCREKPKNYAGEWSEFKAENQAVALMEVDKDLILDHDLESHSADDDEPVTDEWLRSILGEERRAKLGFGFSVEFSPRGEPNIEMEFGKPHQFNYAYNTFDLPECKSRGDVRRLLSVLGVKP